MQQSEFGTLGKIDAVSTVGREGNVVTIWSILARSGAEAVIMVGAKVTTC